MSATPLSGHKRNLLSPLKYVCLSEWWLAKPRLPLQGLAIGGIAYGQRERKFSSTVIAKRYEANVLETEDGVTLQLRGFVNTSRSSQNGFPLDVCEDFLLGFPDDWQKYAAPKSVDGDTGVGQANGYSQKRAVDASPISIHDNHSAERHDISKQSVSANIVECSNSKKTVEGEREDNTASLKSSQSLVATMDNGENVVLVAAPVSQDGNPNNDQSLTCVFDRNPCNVHSGKSMVGSPVSTSKIRTGQSSVDRREEHVRHTRKCRKRTTWIENGPDHLDFNFPENNLSLELNSNTF